MVNEPYQIRDYGQDEVVAFCGFFRLISTTEPKQDINDLSDSYELEIFNTPNTIQFAIFVKKTLQNNIFYFCSFTELHCEANHQELYTLFSIL